ncbi:MAG: hypothetical protein RXO25_00625 [Caldivirga sp.]
MVVRDPETRLRFTETVTGEAKVKTGAGMVKDVPPRISGKLYWSSTLWRRTQVQYKGQGVGDLANGE